MPRSTSWAETTFETATNASTRERVVASTVLRPSNPSRDPPSRSAASGSTGTTFTTLQPAGAARLTTMLVRYPVPTARSTFCSAARSPMARIVAGSAVGDMSYSATSAPADAAIFANALPSAHAHSTLPRERSASRICNDRTSPPPIPAPPKLLTRSEREIMSGRTPRRCPEETCEGLLRGSSPVR